jgi:methionyl-tRNA formyltransferase
VVLIAVCDGRFAVPAFDELRRLCSNDVLELVAVIDAAQVKFASTKERLKRRMLSWVTGSRSEPTLRVQCRRHGVRIFVPPDHKLNAQETADFLRDNRVNYALVFGCDQIVRGRLIETGTRIVNFHNSYLPDYRGVGAAQWVLLDGATETGFTWHIIDDEAIDEGRLVFQQRVPVPPNATVPELTKIICRRASAAIADVIAALESGQKFPPIPKGRKYFSRKKALAARRVDMSLSVNEFCRRVQIMGGLSVNVLGISLRLQEAQPVNPKEHRTRLKSVRIRLPDGEVEVRRVNYMPARLWSPLLRLALRR